MRPTKRAFASSNSTAHNAFGCAPSCSTIAATNRQSAWADAKPDALLTLGIADAYGKRMLMLSGAEEKIELVIGSAASWQVDVTTQE